MKYTYKYKYNTFVQALEKTLGISDVFSAHRQTDEMEKVNEASITIVLILAGCTDQLQRLDQKMNKPYKDILKKKPTSIMFITIV